MNRRIRLAVLGAAIAVTLPGAAQQSPFASFKLNGVETDCVLDRVTDNSFWGADEVSAKGGVKLATNEASQGYDCAVPLMRRGYSKSGLEAAETYQDWQRLSVAPYLSRDHGNRYVNNYANQLAMSEYYKYEQAGPLPIGSVIAKDAFVVNRNGRLVFGSLQIMKKMPPGFDAETDDWRYTLILPDGRVFGSTGGADGGTVGFCHNCHKEQFKTTANPLFFMPAAVRRRIEN